jgi:hypothetical protein
MLRTGMLESLGKADLTNLERYSMVQLSSQDDPITIPYNPIHKWYLGESRKILMGRPAFWHRFFGSPWLSICQSKVARKSLGSPHLQGISQVPILPGLSLENGDITLHPFFWMWMFISSNMVQVVILRPTPLVRPHNFLGGSKDIDSVFQMFQPSF